MNDMRHKVYLSFQERFGWHCQFLEADLRTPLLRRLCFATSDKIIELVRRGDGLQDQECKLILDYAIQKGRGGAYLNLTEEQYRKLSR